jgi:predicted flap endonuclease-1-like 5' DNA nuclease
MDVSGNLVWIILAVVVVAILAFLLLRPRQRVQLSDSTPLRPHMTQPPKPAEGRGIASEIAAATSDVTGDILEAPVHANLSNTSGAPDNLQTLKGVGPKFAQMLALRGVTRFDQLARLSPSEVELLDAQLGPFRGRLQRDRVIEQADYLARGDKDGFEERFGKLDG